MIAGPEQRDKPFQPMGWPIYSYQNAANQARQQADAQRLRVVQLERRNRRLRSATAAALTLLITVAVVVLVIGLLVGYSVGTGLIGLVGR